MYKSSIKRKNVCDFSEYINNFRDIISCNAPHVDLSLFEGNVKNLKIYKNISFFDYAIKLKRGAYDLVKNEIHLVNNNPSYIYHELLHLASTYFNKDKGIIVSGFSCLFPRNGEFITFGSSIDEGYTEVLSKRYFEQSNDSVCYPFEAKWSLAVENILGRNIMEVQYFNGGISELFSELLKYNSEDNIIDFLVNLDFLHDVIYKRFTKNNREVIEKIKEINHFLIISYGNKLLDNETLSKDCYNAKLNSFINNYIFGVSILNNTYFYDKAFLENHLRSIYDRSNNVLQIKREVS